MKRYCIAALTVVAVLAAAFLIVRFIDQTEENEHQERRRQVYEKLKRQPPVVVPVFSSRFEPRMIRPQIVGPNVWETWDIPKLEDMRLGAEMSLAGDPKPLPDVLERLNRMIDRLEQLEREQKKRDEVRRDLH